ncbi:MAG TPA: choice-of-anchor D domain-containing protein, partial [Candidatus Angelobacter sp.]|nr:choice-of-anchor D domain-containing protein [Candidatus Angelobacter sp.]
YNLYIQAVGKPSITNHTSTQSVIYTPSVVTAAPSSLAFGLVLVGSNASLSTTLTNTGIYPVQITSVTAASPYSVTSNCLSSLAAGASCTATVTFAPASAATFNGTLLVSHNGADSITHVPLSGIGTTTPPVASRFVRVTPCRVADTRNPSGPFGGPFLSGGAIREFDIPNSACGIPSTALAYVLNATVVPPGPLGFLTLFPCGQTQPSTSNLNSIDGRFKAVAAIVPAGTNGGICIYASNNTDLALDISGYFVSASNSGALAFFPVTPCRIADTRNASGPLGGPSLVAQAVRTFPILSAPCSIPATAQAYALNFTSVPNGTLSFLTTWPAGQTQPLVSTLNAPTGTVTANAAIVGAGTNGDVSVYVTHSSDLVIDINGYFAPPAQGGLSFIPLTPCRVLDTRNPPGSGLMLDPMGPAQSAPFNGLLTIDVAGSNCGAPASAQAYIVNATVIPPGPLGFLALWPNGTAQPPVSTLNSIDGAVTSNLAIVPTINGSINAYASNPAQLVLDIFGFFAP